MSWVAVGSAAISAVGGYLSSKKGAKSGTSTSAQSGFDPQIQAGTEQAVSAAEQYANAPFQALSTNQAVAGLSQPQLAAQSAALGNAQYIPQWQQTAGQAFTPGNIAAYSSPYTQQVVNAQQALATKQYAQQRAALNSQQGMTGAFGGDRSAVAQAELQNNYALNMNNIAATGLNNAYNAGVSAFQTDRGYAAGQAQAAGSALQATGATAQQTAQAGKTYDYNTFQQGLYWGQNQNAYLAQILGQVPKGSYYSGNQTSMQTPAAGGWGGALAGVAGIVNAGFGNNNAGTGMGALNTGTSDYLSGATNGTIDTNQTAINTETQGAFDNMINNSQAPAVSGIGGG